MLKIGICEDDPTLTQKLHKCILKVVFAYTEVEVRTFRDGAEVINAVKQDDFALDLLFLDIHMNQVDGMRTADFIRKHEVDVDIIFLTVSKEHVFEGYNYKAFAYCLKPIDEEKIKKELVRYMDEKAKCSEVLNINTKGKEIRLSLNKIIYFESEKRMITAHSLTEDIVFYAKLDDVETLVKNKGFLRCHQSYMVNEKMIDTYKRTQIIAQGITIPFSRKYYEQYSQKNNEEDSNVRVTQSLAMNQEETGAIVFVKGKIVGTIFRIRSDKEIRIGRELGQVDIVLDDMGVSRQHCSITYCGKKEGYRVVDYSKNGLFFSDGERMIKNKVYQMKSGDELWIVNAENIIRLG